MNRQPRYVIISPVRDEERYLQETIRSVAGQTLLPAEWVIVNDGSRDGTGAIIDHSAAVYPWITPVHRGDRGFRKAGGGVIDAFYDGYRALRTPEWDFIVKLDGDLSFAADYFARCFAHFAADGLLGIGGGMIYHHIDGRLELEKQPLFHVRGATKIYRHECWAALGGLLAAPGWDTLDELKATMLGWRTQSFADLQLLHHRHTGAADGAWRNAVKNGLANYVSGYHPLFMLAKCLKRLAAKPYLLGATGLLYGYLRGYCSGTARVDDAALIGFIREQQLRKLMLRPSVWK